MTDLKKLNEMISEFEIDLKLTADKRVQLYLLVYRSFLLGAQEDGVSVEMHNHLALIADGKLREENTSK